MSHTIRRLFEHRSTSRSIYENLAREEHLLDTLPRDAACLLLYANDPCVVYGKHQNPWRELDLAACRTAGVPIARRVSGGGAVFHDPGNLNFSFVMPKADFDRRANLLLVARALERLGVRAAVTERFDIVTDQGKISGNAFCFRRELVLHHGTLLVNADLARLRALLRGNSTERSAAENAGAPAARAEPAAERPEGPAARADRAAPFGAPLLSVESFAIASHPSPVTNLGAIAAGLTVEAAADAIALEAARTWALPAEPLDDAAFELPEVRRRAERNRSREWLLDATPRFTARIAPASIAPVPDPPRGPLLELAVEHGRVVAASCEPLGPDAEALVGVRFDSEELARALEALEDPDAPIVRSPEARAADTPIRDAAGARAIAELAAAIRALAL